MSERYLRESNGDGGSRTPVREPVTESLYMLILEFVSRTGHSSKQDCFCASLDIVSVSQV